MSANPKRGLSLEQAIGQSTLFGELDERARSLLERLLVERPARAGERLVREGERPHPYGDALFLVLEGEVEIRRQDRDQAGAGPIARLGPGDFFGVVSLVDDGPRAASCVVASPGRLACLARRTLDALSTSDPPLALAVELALARQMAHDLRIFNERLVARLR